MVTIQSVEGLNRSKRGKGGLAFSLPQSWGHWSSSVRPPGSQTFRLTLEFTPVSLSFQLYHQPSWVFSLQGRTVGLLNLLNYMSELTCVCVCVHMYMCVYIYVYIHVYTYMYKVYTYIDTVYIYSTHMYMHFINVSGDPCLIQLVKGFPWVSLVPQTHSSLRKCSLVSIGRYVPTKV